MSVQRRPARGKPKSGRVQWVVRYRDPAGREHSESHPTERAAKQADAAHARALSLGTWRDPAALRVTVGELFRMWVDSAPRRASTLDLYDNTARRQLGPLADYPARDVTPQHITRWYRDLTTCREWLAPDDTGLAPGTARDQLRRLRSAYRWGMEQGLVVSCPVTVPRAAEDDTVRPEDIPTLAEIRAVEQIVRAGGAQYTDRKRAGAAERVHTMKPHPVAADMIVTAAMTGMRVSELCGLVPEDVDLTGGVIRLTHQLDIRTRVRGPLKSRAGRRVIPIAPELGELLSARMSAAPAGGWLFTGARGAAMRASGLAVYVARASRHAGVTRVHFHSLRHYFASALITAGRPVHEVSAILGHSSAAMTLDTYTHILDRDGVGVRETISAAIACGIFAGESPSSAGPGGL